MRGKDLTGKTYGFITVIRDSLQRATNRQKIWECSCKGTPKNPHQEKLVYIRTDNLERGLTKSCGCYKKELHTKHGHGVPGKNSLEYGSWKSMRGRCNNPNFSHHKYWADVDIYPEWDHAEGFPAFLEYVMEHLGPRPKGKTIDRIDRTKPYEPGNIRWANPAEQARNRSTTKLTEIKVQAIKNRLQDDATVHSRKHISRVYGVHFNTINDIFFGRTWKDVG